MDVASFAFSRDGRFLAVGAADGATALWSLDLETKNNIMNILDATRNNPRFWNDYQISLEGEG